MTRTAMSLTGDLPPSLLSIDDQYVPPLIDFLTLESHRKITHQYIEYRREYQTKKSYAQHTTEYSDTQRLTHFCTSTSGGYQR